MSRTRGKSLPLQLQRAEEREGKEGGRVRGGGGMRERADGHNKGQ